MTKFPHMDLLKLNASEPQKVVILKRTEKSLSGAEAYLRKRGWDVTSTTDVKKLLLLAVQTKPSFVLLAMDHQNTKVIGLPKVLAQVIQAYVIPFLETQSTASLNTVRNINPKYNIIPPISGPKIERLVNRIILDVQREQSNSQNRGERAAENRDRAHKEDDLISIRGQGSKSDFAYLDKGKRSSSSVVYNEEDYEKYNNFLPESGRPSIEYGGLAAHGDTEPTLDAIRDALKNYQGKDLPPEYQRLDKETDAEYDKRLLALERKKYNERKQQESEENFWNELEAGAIEKAIERTGNPEEEEYNDEDAESALRDLLENGYTPPNFLQIDPKHTPKSNFQKVKLQLSKRKDFRRQKMESLKRTDMILKSGKSAKSEELRTIIEAGAQFALDEVHLTSKNNLVDSEIQKTTRAACIEIESARFSGYLVAVMASTTKLDEEFINFVKGKLKEFLKSSGEEIKESENLDIKLQEVQFNEWALSQAEFLRRTVYDGKEVALAFFAAENKGKALGASKRDNMVSMGLDEIRGDHPVEFDLHIYLPTNDKYILYTAQGQIFGAEQKGRLVSRGIDKIHLPKTAIKDVKRYRVQNFLTDKIRSFQMSGAPAA